MLASLFHKHKTYLDMAPVMGPKDTVALLHFSVDTTSSVLLQITNKSITEVVNI
jgi:hypothetical protein